MNIDNIKKLLPEDIANNLSDDSFNALQEAIEQKIDLSIDAALTKQDTEHAEQLAQLMEALEKDNTTKLARVIRKIDADKADKLKSVVGLYEGKLQSEANDFKDDLVNKISSYLEEYIDEAIPVNQIAEATKNNSARVVLNNLRDCLAVDSAAINENVRDALVEGKSQIDDLKEQLQQLSEQNEQLVKEQRLAQSYQLLEELIQEKVKNNKRKATYLRKFLSKKDPDFIRENFDYTARLYDNQEKKELEKIRTEAFNKRTVDGDVKEAKLIEEQVDQPNKEGKQQYVNPYVAELERIK